MSNVTIDKTPIGNAITDMLCVIARSLKAKRPFRLRLTENSLEFQALLKLDPSPFRFQGYHGPFFCEFRGFAVHENGYKQPWLVMVQLKEETPC